MPPVGWYYRLSEFFRNKFGEKVYKIPVDAGFTCPNRDGTLSGNGCIYCYNPSFSPQVREEFVERGNLPVKEQILQYQMRLENKNAYRTPGKLHKLKESKTPVKHETTENFKPSRKYIAYFQSYTNTYAPVPKLQQLYEEALSTPGVVGLSIATRPDCLNADILKLLESYARHNHIWLELGLQSSHDRTLQFINRGHDYNSFREAVMESAGRGLYICAHIINGLPGESMPEMLQTTEKINGLPVAGIKFHQLQVIRNTLIEQLYREGKIEILSRDEYLRIVCDQLENLRAGIVVHRLLSEVYRNDLLLAPRWEVFRGTFSQEVEKELRRRSSFQGKNIASL